MTLKFYFDTHIAKAIAVQLREKGVNVVRGEEVGMAEASDEEHLQYAAENGCVMVSQDADFIALDAHWRQMGRFHAGIAKIPSEYQGEAQISYTVKQLLFYEEAERVGAVDYDTEIANHMIFL